MSRELDVLVAEKVMGWRQVSIQDIFGEWTPMANVPEYLFPPNGPEPEKVPPYSTDIAAAWTVVEKVTEVPRTVEQARRAANTRFMVWWKDADVWAMSAEEAAAAICRAALEAVGEG